MKDQKGFTYIGVMIFVSIIGVGMAATGQIWAESVKREREQELLFVGNQFRVAMDQYAKSSPGTDRSLHRLSDLLKDPRYPDTRRYLRRMYLDPITGSSDWGVVVNPSGGITGVYSLSEDAPIKKSGFASVNRSFEGKSRYSEWIFMAKPQTVASNAKPVNATAMPSSMIPR